MWRATRTPEGPATQRFAQHGDTVTVRAWGSGAAWSVEHAPILLGEADNTDDFRPTDERLARLHRTNPGLRFCRSEAVFDALLPAVLEQKVTGKEAFTSYQLLQRRFGEAAPAPTEAPLMLLPPHPSSVADTPSHVFHACNVERKRSETIRAAASYAHRLEASLTLPLTDAYARLSTLPGVGVWTIAEIGAVAYGDADAVSVGDYHLKNVVTHFFTGAPRGTDEQMLELLEPYRPHRGRVVRLIGRSGITPPKYGPRMTIQQRW